MNGEEAYDIYREQAHRLLGETAPPWCELSGDEKYTWNKTAADITSVEYERGFENGFEVGDSNGRYVGYDRGFEDGMMEGTGDA